VEYKSKSSWKLMKGGKTPVKQQPAIVARVLVVDDNPTARLTLQTVLEAGGYRVDSAASAAEAVDKLDRKQYELVLSDLQMESPEAGLKVLAHAKMMDYQPATAIVTSESDSTSTSNEMLVEPEGVPELLSKVAGMISDRATRRVGRRLRAMAVTN
jgi:CheY-like chemotaxis protein